MTYMDFIEAYSTTNRFKYNHKAIFAQVRKAMKKSGTSRERALREILKANYLKDSKKYEAMKMNLPYEKKIYGAFVSAAYTEAWQREIANMAPPHKFFEQYVNIICTMAMDIDKTYRPTYMLGIDKTEAKELVKAEVNAVSLRDENIALFNSIDIKRAVNWLPKTRFQNGRLIGRDYRTVDENFKKDVKRAYIWKEYVKEQLGSKNFFWKLFHRDDVRAMEGFISAAETVLKDLNFPKEAEEAANREYKESYYNESDRHTFYSIIDGKFNAQRLRDQQAYSNGKEASLNAAYNVSEAPAPEKIPEGKRLVDKNLLKVGFVPRLKTLDQDFEKLQKIEQYLDSGRSINGGASFKLNDGTVIDAVELETVKVAVSNNLDKIRQIKELPEEERMDHIDAQLNDTYGYYTMEQTAEINKFMEDQPDDKKASYREFMEQEERGRRYGAWSNMNQRAIERINSLREANGIEDGGYTAPNLFLENEPVKEKIDMSHLNNSVNEGERAPMIEQNVPALQNEMII